MYRNFLTLRTYIHDSRSSSSFHNNWQHRHHVASLQMIQIKRLRHSVCVCTRHQVYIFLGNTPTCRVHSLSSSWTDSPDLLQLNCFIRLPWWSQRSLFNIKDKNSLEMKRSVFVNVSSLWLLECFLCTGSSWYTVLVKTLCYK